MIGKNDEVSNYHNFRWNTNSPSDRWINFNAANIRNVRSSSRFVYCLSLQIARKSKRSTFISLRLFLPSFRSCNIPTKTSLSVSQYIYLLQFFSQWKHSMSRKEKRNSNKFKMYVYSNSNGSHICQSVIISVVVMCRLVSVGEIIKNNVLRWSRTPIRFHDCEQENDLLRSFIDQTSSHMVQNYWNLSVFSPG